MSKTSLVERINHYLASEPPSECTLEQILETFGESTREIKAALRKIGFLPSRNNSNVLSKTTQRLSYEQVQSIASSKREAVYNYLQKHPGSSRRDVANATGMLINSCTARCRELLDENLIRETGKTKSCPLTGKLVACLEVV